MLRWPMARCCISARLPRDLARVNSPESGLALFRDMLDLGER